ncbi:MAG: acyl-CoA reductase [Verrucomicrobiota bacterium]
MNLPNFYLVDLPPGAELTGAMMAEACRTLKRNRERYLVPRSTASLVQALDKLARNWLEPDYSFRQLALAEGPAATGYSRGTLARGLDAFFRQITAEKLNALLVQELGQANRLDQLAATEVEEKHGQAALAQGPEFILHITAGNIPVPAMLSMILGLLTRSAQVVKLATGDAFIPRVFAHSLYELEPKLGACLELAEWTGGHAALEDVLFHEADCLTVTGSDETVAALRRRFDARKRFLGYGHKVSFGYISKGALNSADRSLVTDAALDVAAWDQQGCLSPHLLYVERGGATSPEAFAAQLADELERLERREPRRAISLEEAAAIATRRSFYEVRAAHSVETKLWQSEQSTAWTVVYDEDARFQTSCLNRFVYVKAVEHLTEALQGADRVLGCVSTVGLAALSGEAQRLATDLARWGVTRVCPLGQMQNPPLLWRHDGRPSLGDLVTWTNWER